MSGKLDQSLDEILATRKSGLGRGRGGRRVGRGGKVVAPVGGVKKPIAKKDTVKAANLAPTSSASAVDGRDTKMIVSNLPHDVTENELKEYFSKAVGPVLRANLTYGPNGQSKGIATVLFRKPGHANEAAKQMAGQSIDGRPMRIEIVVDAARAAQAPVSTLDKRITTNQSKKAAKAEPKKVEAKPVAPKKKIQRGRNAGRPKKKTAEELDADMTDYFGSGQTDGANPNGAAPSAPATEDIEIS